MKSRTGFVSNSSSCSYIIRYKEGGLLMGAQEILSYIQSRKSCHLYILGKLVNEGRDYFYLTPKHKDLILRFPEQWLKNKNLVQALVDDDSLYLMRGETYDGRTLFSPEEEKEYPLSRKFDRDYNCCWDETIDLPEFFQTYILGNEKDISHSDIPSVKPYAMVYRDRLSITDSEQWNSLIQNIDNYPIVISKTYKDEDIVRTLTLVDSLPDYEVSYRDYFILEYEKRKDYESLLDKLVNSSDIEVYTECLINTECKTPRVYLNVFHVEPMFGSYMTFRENEELKRL